MTEEMYVVLALVVVLGLAYFMSKGRSKKAGPKVGGTDSENEVK